MRLSLAGLLQLVCFAFFHRGSFAKNVNIDWRFTSYEPLTIDVGDTLTFIYQSAHNVWMFPNEADFDDCDFDSGAFELATTSESPYVYTSIQEGSFFFGCEVSGHCAAFDMKIQITVLPVEEPEEEEEEPVSTDPPSPTSPPPTGKEVLIVWEFDVYMPILLNIGDSLVFQYTSFHNVWDFLSREEFEMCDFARSSELHGTSGPFTFVAQTSGTFYFGCEVAGHCTADSDGFQGRLKIEVIVSEEPEEEEQDLSDLTCLSGTEREASSVEECFRENSLCLVEVTRDCEGGICRDVSYKRSCSTEGESDGCGDLSISPCREFEEGSNQFKEVCCCDGSNNCNQELPVHDRVPMVNVPPIDWNLQDSQPTPVIPLEICDIISVIAVIDGDDDDNVGTPCETLHLFPGEQAFDECDFESAEIVVPYSTPSSNSEGTIRWEYQIDEDTTEETLYFGCEEFCGRGMKLVVTLEGEGGVKCDVIYPPEAQPATPTKGDEEEEDDDEEDEEDEIDQNGSFSWRSQKKISNFIQISIVAHLMALCLQ